MIDLKLIEDVSSKFETEEELTREMKKVQSVKCRLKKQKGRKDYDEKMTDTLKYEEVLKEVRQLRNPKSKSVTMFEKSDIELLDFDETIKAIRSIQSKKTLSKWLTGIENDNDEYRNAVRIEELLLTHKSEIKPVDESYIRKSELQTVIETINESGKLTNVKIVELLNNLLK